MLWGVMYRTDPRRESIELITNFIVAMRKKGNYLYRIIFDEDNRWSSDGFE